MSKFCLYMPPLSTLSTYKEMVDYAAAHNISNLEILNILDLSTPDLQVAKELKAYADSKGISFPCVSVGMNLVEDDRREAIETLKKYADIAKLLGSPYLHHTIALNFSDPAYIAENFETFYQRGLEAVREVFDYAATLGIRTIYEDQGFLFNGRKTSPVSWQKWTGMWASLLTSAISSLQTKMWKTSFPPLPTGSFMSM